MRANNQDKGIKSRLEQESVGDTWRKIEVFWGGLAELAAEVTQY